MSAMFDEDWLRQHNEHFPIFLNILLFFVCLAINNQQPSKPITFPLTEVNVG